MTPVLAMCQRRDGRRNLGKIQSMLYGTNGWLTPPAAAPLAGDGGFRSRLNRKALIVDSRVSIESLKVEIDGSAWNAYRELWRGQFRERHQSAICGNRPHEDLPSSSCFFAVVVVFGRSVDVKFN